VRVIDELTKGFAYCFVSITHQQSIFELKEDPFQIHEAIANSIRSVVDEGTITFYSSASEHPVELQHVQLQFVVRASVATDLSEYLKHKVLLLGFKSGGKDTQVWIADPWDANYLGVDVLSLRQEAEILEAERFLQLDEERAFARAGHQLLLLARPSSQGIRPLQANGLRKEEAKHDVFLSHASEDKSFVRELAAELSKRGITYWLDENEIKLGDSLRQVIDRGLRSSRSGVVILSKHFFAKEWPKRELDGLLESEIDKKVVLPVWHEVTVHDVRTYSLTLAGRYAARSSDGAPAVTDAIQATINSQKT
jgi:hypothetical protein